MNASYIDIVCYPDIIYIHLQMPNELRSTGTYFAHKILGVTLNVNGHLMQHDMFKNQ